MDLGLAGKVAVVTGGSRGIGLATAECLIAEGAKVVIAARRQEHLDSAASRLGVDAIQIDVTKIADLDRLSAHVEHEYGGVDILVNNAAAADMTLPSAVTTAQRNFMYDLNVNVPIELAQQAMPSMRERGAGWILNISSHSCEQPIVPYRDSAIAAHVITAYGATKAALNRYSSGLAHEVAEHGICVNTLAPENIVLTSGAEYVRDIARRNPDMAEPVEMMAEAALALCSGSILGQICYSRQLVHSMGISVKSLDGQTILGSALLPADLDASV